MSPHHFILAIFLVVSIACNMPLISNTGGEISPADSEFTQTVPPQPSPFTITPSPITPSTTISVTAPAIPVTNTMTSTATEVPPTSTSTKNRSANGQNFQRSNYRMVSCDCHHDYKNLAPNKTVSCPRTSDTVIYDSVPDGCPD